uniref:prepilin-type N-terminal cleavage/methylation domain-containing protein n=1 Tax=Sphingomonas sp. TaxID=28214 RepID=UPI0025E4F110
QTTGFTLLELLVVLAIFGLVTGLAFPALDRAIKLQAFRTVSAQVDLGMRQARADAIRQGRSVVSPPFANSDSNASVGLATQLLTPSVKVAQTDAIRFFRDGTSNGGSVDISSGGHKTSILVDAQTGTVTSKSL